MTALNKKINEVHPIFFLFTNTVIYLFTDTVSPISNYPNGHDKGQKKRSTIITYHGLFYFVVYGNCTGTTENRKKHKRLRIMFQRQ